MEATPAAQDFFLTQVERRFLDVEGVRVHCLVAGTGEPVVLLHGLGASSAVWHRTIAALAPRFTVAAPDLPNHGDSQRGQVDYTLEGAIRVTVGILDALSFERAALVGNSLGGLMCLAAALRHPERVSKLVLVDSAGLSRRLSIFLHLATLPGLGRLLERPTLPATRAILRRIFYDRRRIPEALLHELHRVRSIPGSRDGVLRTLRAGVNLWGLKGDYLLLGQLPHLQAPLMVAWGAQDTIVPNRDPLRIKTSVPQAQVEVFQGCGHWPQVEMAEQFNRSLLNFLITPAPVEARAEGERPR
ncbi:MAG: alpha/beta fold hydrolase [Chloroflexi bacterium]|nr:alpha/beta fold hydrolase [Chloroflexota bacterium]